MISIDEILSDDSFENVKIYIREISFNLKELSPVIKIRLYKQPNDQRVFFEQSHFLDTPIQADPYRTSTPFADDEEGALRHAVRTFMDFFPAAVEQGHKPSDEWLVPNSDF
jgi:hypothetical protein